jgi:hypothetical protein
MGFSSTSWLSASLRFTTRSGKRNLSQRIAERSGGAAMSIAETRTSLHALDFKAKCHKLDSGVGKQPLQPWNPKDGFHEPPRLRIHSAPELSQMARTSVRKHFGPSTA